MRKRNISIPIRVTEKELSVIDKKSIKGSSYTNRISYHLRSWQGDNTNRGLEADFSRFEASW